MYARFAKRLFTHKAIECWFDRLTAEWENHFTREELEAGRLLYRRGEIREVELSEMDAIIHCKFDKKECYALVDWESGRMSVRASTLKKSLGRAIAVAGMYEIEEMVIEEVAPIPDFLDQQEEEPGAEEPEERPRAEEREPRPLDLELTLSGDGLTLSAHWLREQERQPALLPPPSGDFPTSKEREKIIRLAGLARRSGFLFIKQRGVYRLPSLLDVPEFVQKALPGWRKHFPIRMDKALEQQVKRVREVDLTLLADGGKEGVHAHLNWLARVGRSSLDDAQLGRLIKQGRQPLFIEGLGIIKMGDRQRRAVRAVQEWKLPESANAVPRYLLLSLFSEGAVGLKLSRELNQWRKQLMGRVKRHFKDLPGFLRDYQRHGVEWMSHLEDASCHGLLADEMGLGKTLQVVTLLKMRQVEDLPSIIVCPASVVPVWRAEFERWYPGTRVEVLRSGQNFVEQGGQMIWLASYTQLRRNKALLSQQEFGYAVLDEAQQIKNPDTKVSQSCFAINARNRIAVTGTPIENRSRDLWSIFRFLMPGLLGPRREFEEHLDRDPDEFFDKLHQQLAPFILRRTKKDVAKELPEKVELDLYCPLTPYQQREYAKLTSEGIERFGEALDAVTGKESFNLLSLLTRLRQACCDPALLPWVKESKFEDSGKLQLLMDRLPDILSAKHKVVVFSQFVSFLDRTEAVLKERFPKLKLYRLTGSTVDRQSPVAQFQKQKDAAVMLVSLKAGGTGITLHAADYVFLLDPWWNPAVEHQAIDRVHRIGQDKTVFVYRLITQGTIEERIQQLKGEKSELFDRVVGGMRELRSMTQYFEKLSDLILLSTLQDSD